MLTQLKPNCKGGNRVFTSVCTRLYFQLEGEDEIGRRIKVIRECKGMPKKEFASLINASDTTVSNWEKGVSRPDVNMLARICLALQVSADELLNICIGPDNLTKQERKLILSYREKPELHNAVNVLLGIDDAGDEENKI